MRKGKYTKKVETSVRFQRASRDNLLRIQRCDGANKSEALERIIARYFEKCFASNPEMRRAHAMN